MLIRYYHNKILVDKLTNIEILVYTILKFILLEVSHAL